MIAALTLILLCQLVDEVVARGTGWPVPGPVIGMALLLAFLAARDHAPEFLPRELADGTLEAAGKGLLAHLTLLFVPTGVGVV
jgi:holin-like protein